MAIVIDINNNEINEQVDGITHLFDLQVLNKIKQVLVILNRLGNSDLEDDITSLINSIDNDTDLREHVLHQVMIRCNDILSIFGIVYTKDIPFDLVCKTLFAVSSFEDSSILMSLPYLESDETSDINILDHLLTTYSDITYNDVGEYIDRIMDRFRTMVIDYVKRDNSSTIEMVHEESLITLLLLSTIDEVRDTEAYHNLKNDTVKEEMFNHYTEIIENDNEDILPYEIATYAIIFNEDIETATSSVELLVKICFDTIDLFKVEKMTPIINHVLDQYYTAFKNLPKVSEEISDEYV